MNLRLGEIWNQKKKKKPKIPRQSMPEQDPRRRRHNYEEVPYGYTDELAKTEASRCLKCKKPLCVTGCPVNIRIPDFIKLIDEGNSLKPPGNSKSRILFPL